MVQRHLGIRLNEDIVDESYKVRKLLANLFIGTQPYKGLLGDESSIFAYSPFELHRDELPHTARDYCLYLHPTPHPTS